MAGEVRRLILGAVVLGAACLAVPDAAVASRYFPGEEIARAHGLRVRVLGRVPGLAAAVGAAGGDALAPAAADDLLQQLKALERAEAENPFYHWALGEVRRRAGDAAAAADFERATAAAKAHPLVHWLLWEAFLERDQLVEADRELAALQEIHLSWGLARFPRLSERLVREARLAASRHAYPKAVRLLKRAMDSDPSQAAPHLLMAKVLWGSDKANVPSALRSLAAGIHLAWQSRGTRQLILGNLLGDLILAFQLGLGIFALVLFLRCQGLLTHDLRHGFLGRFTPPGRMALVAIALLLPVFLGLGLFWTILLSLILWAPYLRGRERLTVAALLVALGFLPAAYRGVARYHLLAASPQAVLAEEVEAGARGGEILDQLRQWARHDPRHYMPAYYLGVVHRRRGELDAGAEELRRATELTSGRSAPWVALGNIRSLQGDKDAALEAYGKATSLTGNSAPGHLNAGLLYAERFHFDRARREFEEAIRLDPRLASALSASQQARAGGFLADERLGASEIWEPFSPGDSQQEALAAAIWTGMLRHVPLQVLPLVAGAALVALGVAALWGRRAPHARRCEQCGKVFCARCQTTIPADRLCSACAALATLREGIAAPVKIQRLRDAEEFQDRRRRMVAILALSLPGAGHLYLGRTLGGLLLLLPALFTLSELFVGRLLVPQLRIPSDLAWLMGGVTMVPLLAALYAVSAFRCARLLGEKEG